MEKLDPQVHLKLMGDWGNANFHMIVGWICAHMRWRSEPGSTFWMKTGTGYRDNINAVANGEVDLAVTTPLDVTLEWAREGKEFFKGTPFPHLRSLGYFPQDDRLVFCVARLRRGVRQEGIVAVGPQMRIQCLGALLRGRLHHHPPAALKRFLEQGRQHIFDRHVLQVVEQDFRHPASAISWSYFFAS